VAPLGSGIAVGLAVGADVAVAVGAAVVAAGVGEALVGGVGEACVAAGAQAAAMKRRTKGTRFMEESIYLTDDVRICGVPTKAYECATRYVR